MTQITIETQSIKNFVIAIFAIIGFIMVALLGASYLINSGGSNNSPVTSQSSIVSAPTYPSVLTFTVLSTTTSNGKYQVTTTSGNILYFADYGLWDSMIPRATYTATLVGMDGIAYEVGSVVRISNPPDYYPASYYSYYDQSYDNGGVYYNGYSYTYHDPLVNYKENPTYWHYGNSYYQCDKVVCNKVSYKQVAGELVYNGRPPRPIR